MRLMNELQRFRDKRKSWGSPGISAALVAALLFGASTPLAKALLAKTDPWVLAGLLYLGSGVGLAFYRLLRRSPVTVRLPPTQWKWFVGAVAAGGVLAPVLLMSGLTQMAASTASLLLNAESVFTALLAWFVFRENVDWRIALGMVAIVAGALVLTWPAGDDAVATLGLTTPVMLVFGACLAWAIDNNLTRKVSLADPTWIACIKGLVAGATNLLLAFAFADGSSLPSVGVTAAALSVGCVAYGISLSLFVLSLRLLGTARTGAYFSVAPFFGAAVSIWLLDEAFTVQLAIAGMLMVVGVWLHLTENHRHRHAHEFIAHEHEHEHDEHHQHEYGTDDGSVREKHSHRHEPLTHEHAHYPDVHHRHDH